MITDQEKYKIILEKFKETILGLVKECFNEYSEIAPVAFGLIAKKDKLGIAVIGGLGELMQSEKDKDKLALVMKEITKEIKPIAMVFVTEGWAIERDTEDDILDKQGNFKSDSVRPSNAPDKKLLIGSVV